MVVQQSQTELGLPASQLERVFRRAGVLIDQLDTTQSARAKSTRIGQWLSPLVGRRVSIEVAGRTGTATLRCLPGRSREKRYHFEVVWDDSVSQAQADGETTIPPALSTSLACEGQMRQQEQPATRSEAEPDAQQPNTTPTDDEATSQQPDTARQHGNEEDW